MTGAARVAKLKEAEGFRDQAAKSMERGMFTRADPIAAGNFYKRAAEAYGLCGENRLERLHRIAAADLQMGQRSFPTAAHEYTKAAVLAKTSDEKLERKRKEGWKLYGDAAKAWLSAGETGKAANAQIQSAMAWTWEDESTMIDQKALSGIEEAVEAHVPDVLNVYARHRQTGTSKFADPGAEPGAQASDSTLALAREHVVNVPYAHEPLQDVATVLVHYGEYQSALYAVGAASYILENDGVSTLTLSRSFVMETILSLAMGDPVAAEEQFLKRHVQKNAYLTSRECRLAEELFRAVLTRDVEGLEEVRSPTGHNSSALANLHQNFRVLVTQLRISGMARRVLPSTPTDGDAADDDSDEEEVSPLDEPEAVHPAPSEKKKKKKKDKSKDRSAASKTDKSRHTKDDTNAGDDDDDELDDDALAGELDDLMKGLDELDDLGGVDDDLDGLDDDDIDLR